MCRISTLRFEGSVSEKSFIQKKSADLRRIFLFSYILFAFAAKGEGESRRAENCRPLGGFGDDLRKRYPQRVVFHGKRAFDPFGEYRVETVNRQRGVRI